MKLKRFKTLDYDNLKNDAKKCLSPVIKKITNNNIALSLKKIKYMFTSYEFNVSNNIKIYKELATSNKKFMNYIHRYYSYTNFIKKKEKHKIKKEQINEINNLKLQYIKKGYKIPNFHNLFKRNPLNLHGISIRQYFNELYKKDKKKISIKEKNIDFLLRLERIINNLKNNKNLESNDYIKSANISPKRRHSIMKKFKYFESPENKYKNMKNLMSISNNIFNNIENESNINFFNKNKSISKNINKNLIEENDEFKELNEYEKKRILNIIKEEENIRNYKQYINRILNDKNFFNVIDSDEIELDKEFIKQNNNIDSLDIRSNKIDSSISIINLKRKSKINSNLNDISFSSEKPEIKSNKNIDINIKKKFDSNPKLLVINNNCIYSRNIKNPKLKKSLTLKYFDDNQKNIPIENINKNEFSNLTNIKNKLKEKRLSYSTKRNSIFNFKKLLNENDKTNKNILKIYDLKNHNNINIKNTHQNIIKKKFLNKEESLNYLFKKINSEKNLKEDFINEFKNYFIKNKNISENILNNYINRKYDITDFANLCTSIDKKIKEGNIMNKWKKNYLKIGKLDKIKNLLEKEGKQDYFINHLLQNFMNSMDGKRKFYDYDNEDYDLI